LKLSSWGVKICACTDDVVITSKYHEELSRAFDDLIGCEYFTMNKGVFRQGRKVSSDDMRMYCCGVILVCIGKLLLNLKLPQ
jgi:hypothetical protein